MTTAGVAAHAGSVLAYDIPWVDFVIPLVVKMLAIALLVPLSALVLGYLFLKLLAHMQSRLGPMEAGGFHGWAQLIADGLKFMQKEDVIPEAADKPAFAMAPAFVLVSVVLVMITIPFGPSLNVIDIDAQVFMALAVASIGTIGVLLAGWSSANKYSLMGGFRAAGQLMAYELPLLLSIVAVVMMAQTMNMQGIISAQGGFELFGTIPIPYVVPQFVAFAVFIVAAQAELSQAPFDMPFAESELVSGYATEYTGFRYLFFFIAEFASNFTMAAIGAVLFLGGWWLPWVPEGVLEVIGPFVLVAKILFLVFLFLWMRSTYPRLREDQLQRFAWKWLIPISLVNIGITGVLKVVW